MPDHPATLAGDRRASADDPAFARARGRQARRGIAACRSTARPTWRSPTRRGWGGCRRRSPTSPAHVWRYTGRRNTVAVLTNGTAVLGLGDIGPEAALPVMEGKAVLFKQFAGIDA